MYNVRGAPEVSSRCSLPSTNIAQVILAQDASSSTTLAKVYNETGKVYDNAVDLLPSPETVLSVNQSRSGLLLHLKLAIAHAGALIQEPTPSYPLNPWLLVKHTHSCQ